MTKRTLYNKTQPQKQRTSTEEPPRNGQYKKKKKLLEEGGVIQVLKRLLQIAALLPIAWWRGDIRLIHCSWKDIFQL